jgi:hypothetical protein
LPAVDKGERSKSADDDDAKLQSLFALNQVPQVVPCARKKNPVAMVVRPLICIPYSPSILPDFFKHYNHPHQKPQDRFAVIGANLQETQLMGTKQIFSPGEVSSFL